MRRFRPRCRRCLGARQRGTSLYEVNMDCRPPLCPTTSPCTPPPPAPSPAPPTATAEPLSFAQALQTSSFSPQACRPSGKIQRRPSRPARRPRRQRPRPTPANPPPSSPRDTSANLSSLPTDVPQPSPSSQAPSAPEDPSVPPLRASTLWGQGSSWRVQRGPAGSTISTESSLAPPTSLSAVFSGPSRLPSQVVVSPSLLTTPPSLRRSLHEPPSGQHSLGHLTPPELTSSSQEVSSLHSALWAHPPPYYPASRLPGLPSPTPGRTGSPQPGPQ